jgi:hypothetical protein
MNIRCRSVAVTLVCAACVVTSAQTALTGRWQGTTVSGQPIVLDVKENGQQLTGRLTVGGESAEITEGKVEGKTCSFRVVMEGRTLSCDARLVGEELELTVQHVARPLTLKRAK